MSQSKSSVQLLFLFVASVVIVCQQAHSSGIFELNLSALTDEYKRDLRLDCCAWQNASQEKQQQVLAGTSHNLIQPSSGPILNSVSSGRYAAAAAESCDPTKCQLIIRICVKNYQTQIEPSQCTFGELSAQVMRPDEAAAGGAARHNQHPHHHHNHHHLNQQQQNHMSSLARLQQQQQLAGSFQKLKLSANSNLQQQQPSNIHHQRMLLQQLQQAPYLSQGPTSSEQHARLYHQAGLGGSARNMRQIAFDQPISFPFNFTWPVSVLLYLRCFQLARNIASNGSKLFSAPLARVLIEFSIALHRSNL